ncbi:DUF3795 domain-containing protein [candidate division WOR-3 bacterium]|uniref:DUF3795 domain-containing protein n=1 Tax=candidate division WOR-3 bacterium TaxID=2052148 RepID=A0A9D5K9V2_UNCW3|nr:DUF3795 domain-containing protein [candidate division WOR-3 bacterium]MBD3364294.1 DUF3795 domain-containing protein [candidate division WOR-3 bacterium]
MAKIIAYCGINCAECPAYLAHKNDDDELRAVTAEKWSKAYNSDIKPEYVNCDGCTMEGRHVGYCSKCGVRKCASAKGAQNCAHCPDYPCETLEAFLKMAPRVKENLEEIRANL